MTSRKAYCAHDYTHDKEEGFLYLWRTGRFMVSITTSMVSKKAHTMTTPMTSRKAYCAHYFANDEQEGLLYQWRAGRLTYPWRAGKLTVVGLGTSCSKLSYHAVLLCSKNHIIMLPSPDYYALNITIMLTQTNLYLVMWSTMWSKPTADWAKRMHRVTSSGVQGQRFRPRVHGFRFTTSISWKSFFLFFFNFEETFYTISAIYISRLGWCGSNAWV